MRYIATGRVHPERADIRFGPIQWTFEKGGRVAVSCDASQLTVMLELDDVDGWRTACIRAEQYAQVVVGALGFALGSGYSVEIVQVTEADGTPHVFGVRPTGASVTDTLGFQLHDGIFERAVRLAAQDVYFRLALRDYLRAITDAIDCATYCYRAIEAIKSSMALKAGSDSWQAMHDALGTDRSTIERTVKDWADPVRHGNWASARPTNGQERWAMLKLVREILTKYMDHVGSPPNQPLQPASGAAGSS
jgi:hypothetical protein